MPTTEPGAYVLTPVDTRELHASIELTLYKHEMERKLRQTERWLAATLKSIGRQSSPPTRTGTSFLSIPWPKR